MKKKIPERVTIESDITHVRSGGDETVGIFFIILIIIFILLTNGKEI